MSKTGSFNANDYQVKVETPEGEAMWASLAVPKCWNDGDAGNYQISLILSKEDAEDISVACNKVRDDLFAELEANGGNIKMAPHSPWKDTDDGRVEFRFKKPHFEANDKYPASTPVSTYLQDGSKVDWSTTDWAIGNGSTVKVGGFIRPYYVAAAGGLGVTIRLEAVKVYKLEKYQAGGGDSFGFSNGDGAAEEIGQPAADF